MIPWGRMKQDQYETYDQYLAASVKENRDELRAIVMRLIEIADTQPFCSVGHAIEHVVPNARLAVYPAVEPARNGKWA